jgi:hypothetical protein
MRSDAKKTFYFHANASSLGGFIEKPFQKHIPPQASSTLPSVGGHVTSRTEAFNFEGVISCRAGYTRVSGRHIEENGSATVSVTSVLEGLNILEIVKAERVVAQVTAEYSAKGGFPRVSFAGSHFDRLTIGHADASLAVNAGLLGLPSGAKALRVPITESLFHETGRQQAAKLVKSAKAEADQDSLRWLTDRYGWMDSDRKPGKDGFLLCSLVDGVGGAIPGRSFGHVLEIPDFGRIFLGELLVSQATFRISMIRAELGCTVHGGGNGSCAAVAVHGVPP